MNALPWTVCQGYRRKFTAQHRFSRSPEAVAAYCVRKNMGISKPTLLYLQMAAVELPCACQSEHRGSKIRITHHSGGIKGTGGIAPWLVLLFMITILRICPHSLFSRQHGYEGKNTKQGQG